MNFIFPDTPETIAAAEPIYDFGWIFMVIGGLMLLGGIFVTATGRLNTFTQKLTATIILSSGGLSILGGIMFSSTIRPAIIAEAEANSPQPVSLISIFQQAAETTYGLTLTEQNVENLLTREGYYPLERQQLDGDMRDGEPGQVWRAGQIEIAPDGEYQALQLIWVDDEWLLIDITDPTQPGIQEVERIITDAN